MLPFTQKILMDWGGPLAFRDGKNLLERCLITDAEYEPPYIRGTLEWGNRSITTQARVLPDHTCVNECPCRDSRERGVVCAHVIALALTLLARHNDPQREQKLLEERRRAERARLAEAGAFFQRAPQGNAQGEPVQLRLELCKDWQEGCARKAVRLRCRLRYAGAWRPPEEVPRSMPLRMEAKDEAILFVLEDIAEGAIQESMTVSTADFINLLELHIAKPLFEEGRGEPLVVNAARMNTVIRMDLDRENGELLLVAETGLPHVRAGQFPFYIVAGRHGWVFGAGHFWPLDNLLPEPLRSIYVEPVAIARPDVPRFLRDELPQLSNLIKIDTEEISPDLFCIEPETPAFRLEVRGSPASLAFTLWATYGTMALVAGKPDPKGFFAHPDPHDLLRYTVRNPAAEDQALRLLSRFDLRGDTGDEIVPLVGVREVNNFLGSVLPELRRRGWKVDLTGKVDGFMEQARHVTPVVSIENTGDERWFDVRFSFEDAGGALLPPAEVQCALLKGESYLERGDQTLLLDASAIQALRDVFADCTSGEGRAPGSFRLPASYAAYVKAALDGVDGVDVEAPPDWLKAVERQNRLLPLEPVSLTGELGALLRPYQREGVNWLRFLERNSFGGILADEMGLGKTVQTLAWIALNRQLEEARGKPSLIVCPTSLVENWREEAQRFTPQLKVVTMSGAERHERWAEVIKADLVVTSYALIRRDIDQYTPLQFSILVLDEAQHIKNRATQNALAAKKLWAHHRVVLTGTPIENSVSDLWSIMDFLMPGYMSTHEVFKERYENPINVGGPESEMAQWRLKRKLHPFLLRRLKREVARDLPPKIERTAFCTLSPEQREVYQALLESSRQKLQELVAHQGFERSRMEILNLLLRLRQVCCHPELLKLANLKLNTPSAKLDLFFELLDEALDAGHRVLVFSQFVSMLTILRREIERRQWAYCYLDGSTQERMKVVHTFNSTPSIPVFLISLKAGGTGLNLTGADMVIHYDPWWNPAVENQATDRAYRIGQKRTVYSVKLIARDSIEERVLAMQKRKQAIMDATLENEEQIMGKLTLDDVRELLEL